MSESQRIDKWLWHARVVKTRSLASDLISGGHVRLNRVRTAKPSQIVRPGDVVTVTLRSRIRILRIEAVAERRGSASDAATLYSDLTPPVEKSDAPVTAAVQRPQGSGRPTKRDRRRIDAWKERPHAPDDGEI